MKTDKASPILTGRMSNRIVWKFIIGMLVLYPMALAEVCISGGLWEKTRHTHRSRCAPRHPRTLELDPLPYFDSSTNRNITTVEGKVAYLPCRVRLLGDRTVSWIRRHDLHVLTVGKFTYTNDQRVRVLHIENTDDWTLQVKYPQKKDAGVYECQVSTVPKKSIFVMLDIVESKAQIAGGPSLYINSGSTLNLTCYVSDSPVAPDYVFWYHNSEVINYDTPRGIKVHTEKRIKTMSNLLISNAQPTDSGNYSCVPSNAQPATISVHVLNGENPAAMQHGKRATAKVTSSNSGTDPHLHLSAFLLLIFSVFLQNFR